MEPEEKEICAYLKGVAGQFVSAREICRRAGGKWRYRDNPEWAIPFLVHLVERKVLESDATSHYRLIKRNKKNRMGKWLSPQMREILESSGKDLGGVVPDEDVEEDGTAPN